MPSHQVSFSSPTLQPFANCHFPFPCKQHNMSLCKCALMDAFALQQCQGFLNSSSQEGNASKFVNMLKQPSTWEGGKRLFLCCCSFNEGMAVQFCNYWHRKSFKILFWMYLLIAQCSTLNRSLLSFIFMWENLLPMFTKRSLHKIN